MGALLTTRIGIITLLTRFIFAFAVDKDQHRYFCCVAAHCLALLLWTFLFAGTAAVDCGGAFAMCNLGSLYPCIS